jgi:hypothetical protein
MVRIYPLLGNGCVSCAVIRPVHKGKPTIIVSTAALRVVGVDKKENPVSEVITGSPCSWGI